jgi:hypothetical protein
MSSISSAALADSVSDSSEPGCEPSPSASVTSIAEQFSASIGQPSHASTTSIHLTQTDWVGSDESISSVVASLVSPSASPESKERTKTTATYGRKCAALLHSRDPLGSLAKTLLVSSRWHSTMCNLTWKASATPRGRLLFRLVPSMRDTDETASGSLLATPTAKANQLAPSMLAKWPSCSALLPTPTARDWKDGTAQACANVEPNGLLGRVVHLLPTPHANCHTGPGSQGREGGLNLQTHVGGALNPQWVEWLMGFPDGWTALEPSEMPSSRKSSKRSGEQSCSASS